jgi:tetratricopeptide (TPR) repeat protein
MIADPPVDDDRFVDMLTACDDALAGGTWPDLSGDLPSEDLRPRVERGVAFLVRLQQLRQSPPPDNKPTVIDRFAIRRELGRGGFGVVYLAHDPRLGRDVALKVPHAGALADGDLRRRFQAEAQTVAGLDHPNLVPVYETGEAGDLCYLVSAYCPGGTLADWLREQSEPVTADDAAALVETLARTVQYAHERGVLHRDLKPANVLLQFSDGKSDIANLGSVVPRIADFGLAKRLAAEGPETKAGTYIGTPSYMAPEQAKTGGDVGPATDVYALGAILYECLTGRPPFQGDGPLDTLAQVRLIEPVPPRRLRPRVPRDLETICLKCLEKSPGRRYASADELSEDLARFRAGEPVAARRVGAIGRAWRWANRRPVVAGLAAALVITVIGGTTAVVWQWQRAEANAVAMRDQRDAADRQRRRAEANFRRAAVAVRGMAAAGDELYHQRGREEIGRKIVEQAAKFHEGFVAEKGDDPGVLLDAARGWSQAAMIRQGLGQVKSAIAANDRAVDLYDRLLDIAPGNRIYRLERGKRLRAVALYYMAWGNNFDDADRAFAAARTAFEGLCADFPDDPGFHYYLGNTLMNHGALLGINGRTEQGAEMLERAIEMERQALAAKPNDRGLQVELALGQESLGNLLWNRDRSARGDELCREARESFKRIVTAAPVYREGRWYVVRATIGAGDRAVGAGRSADAEREYRAGLDGVAVLRKEAPRYATYAAEQAVAAVKLADVVAGLERADEAEALYRRATALAERLANDFPDEMLVRRVRPATAHIRFAGFLTSRGRPIEAIAVLAAARKFWPNDSEVEGAVHSTPAATR